MENPSRGRVGRVDELDGLRGLLAVWVVVSHIICMTGAAEIQHPVHLQSTWSTFAYAQPAVETFMILSGFAITFLLHARPQSYSEFMLGRFFRIVPIYLFCLALGTWVTLDFTPWFLSHAPWRDVGYLLLMREQSAVEHEHFGLCLGLHLLLLHGLVPSSVLLYSPSTLLPPAWSISVEWQYYLVALFIPKLIRSNIALIAALFICLVLKRENVGLAQKAFLPQRLDLFLVGIGSYHLYASWKSAGAPRLAWITTAVAVAFVVSMLGGTHSVALMIWVVTFGAGFLAGRDAFSRLLGRIRSVLLYPSIQYLGRWSYPLYLVHWPLLILGLCALLHAHPDLSGLHARLLMLVFALPLTIGISALLHYAIELPFMRMGRHLAHLKPVPPVHAPLRKVM